MLLPANKELHVTKPILAFSATTPIPDEAQAIANALTPQRCYGALLDALRRATWELNGVIDAQGKLPLDTTPDVVGKWSYVLKAWEAIEYINQASLALKHIHGAVLAVPERREVCGVCGTDDHCLQRRSPGATPEPFCRRCKAFALLVKAPAIAEPIHEPLEVCAMCGADEWVMRRDHQGENAPFCIPCDSYVPLMWEGEVIIPNRSSTTAVGK